MNESVSYLGKKVKIFLENNINYFGKVFNEDNEYIYIIDKYGYQVSIKRTKIELIQEIKVIRQ